MTDLSAQSPKHLPNGERLIDEPIYPEDWECCNNGCEELCVYEIYRTQKQRYDDQQKRLKAMTNKG